MVKKCAFITFKLGLKVLVLRITFIQLSESLINKLLRLGYKFDIPHIKGKYLS